MEILAFQGRNNLGIFVCGVWHYLPKARFSGKETRQPTHVNYVWLAEKDHHSHTYYVGKQLMYIDLDLPTFTCIRKSHLKVAFELAAQTFTLHTFVSWFGFLCVRPRAVGCGLCACCLMQPCTSWTKKKQANVLIYTYFQAHLGCCCASDQHRSTKIYLERFYPR